MKGEEGGLDVELERGKDGRREFEREKWKRREQRTEARQLWVSQHIL